jgi:hypothetical protein
LRGALGLADPASRRAPPATGGRRSSSAESSLRSGSRSRTCAAKAPLSTGRGTRKNVHSMLFARSSMGGRRAEDKGFGRNLCDEVRNGLSEPSLALARGLCPPCSSARSAILVRSPSKSVPSAGDRETSKFRAAARDEGLVRGCCCGILEKWDPSGLDWAARCHGALVSCPPAALLNDPALPNAPSPQRTHSGLSRSMRRWGSGDGASSPSSGEEPGADTRLHLREPRRLAPLSRPTLVL